MKRFLSLSTMAAGMLAGTQCAACVKSWKFFAIKSDHSCDANTCCCVFYDKVQPQVLALVFVHLRLLHVSCNAR